MSLLRPNRYQVFVPGPVLRKRGVASWEGSRSELAVGTVTKVEDDNDVVVVVSAQRQRQSPRRCCFRTRLPRPSVFGGGGQVGVLYRGSSWRKGDIVDVHANSGVGSSAGVNPAFLSSLLSYPILHLLSSNPTPTVTQTRRADANNPSDIDLAL